MDLTYLVSPGGRGDLKDTFKGAQDLFRLLNSSEPKGQPNIILYLSAQEHTRSTTRWATIRGEGRGKRAPLYFKYDGTKAQGEARDTNGGGGVAKAAKDTYLRCQHQSQWSLLPT